MTSSMLVVTWLCCFSMLSAATITGTYYIQNKWKCYESESRCNEWLSFTGTSVELYSADNPNKAPWQFIPTGEKNTYYIQNRWRCDYLGAPDSRCNDWLSFSGDSAVLVGADETPARVPWELVPAHEPNTYYFQNKWRCPSESRCNRWLEFSGDSATVDSTKVPWLLVPTACTADQVKGEWVYLLYVTSASDYQMKHGTTKKYDESKSQTWSDSVTVAVKAGFQLEAFSASTSVSTTIAHQVATSYSDEWSTKEEESFTVHWGKHDINKAVWQFHLFPHDNCGHTETTLTKDFALTPNRNIVPCCLPGYSIGNPAYRICTSHDAMIPGGEKRGCKVQESWNQQLNSSDEKTIMV